MAALLRLRSDPRLTIGYARGEAWRLNSIRGASIFIVDTQRQKGFSMLVQLAKWGNSIALRIPAAYAKAIGASDRGQAELSIEDGKLVVSPVPGIARFDLDVLVSRITDENRHDEVQSGGAVGGEFG